MFAESLRLSERLKERELTEPLTLADRRVPELRRLS
jgi:hypothetical protein